MSGFGLRWQLQLGLVLALALAFACGPQDPLQEIRAAQEQRRFQQTIDRLRELVDEDPSNAEASLLLGTALLETGNGGLAVWPLRRASESPEYAVEGGLLLVRAMLEGRTGPDALTAIDKVLALEPENVRALALRVQANIKASKPEDVLSGVDRVLELDPEHLGVLVPRITTLISLGRIDEAEAAIETARERFEAAPERVSPSNRARLCIVRGLFLFEKGEGEEVAEAQYAECIEAYPTEPLAVTQAVRFYDRIGNRARATEILEAALAESGNGAFRLALARRMGALGKPEEEERLIREEAEVRSSGMAWFTLADYYVQHERFDEALEAFERAIAVSRPGPPQLRFAYADTLAQAERYDEARRVAQRLEQPELRALIRGRVLLGEGNARAALAAFETGIRLWPNNPAGRFLAAQAAERAGDFPRAASHYRESVRAHAGGTEAGLALAELFARRGEYQDALVLIRRYVQSHPRDPRGYRASIRFAHEAGRHGVAAEGLTVLGRLPGQAVVAVADEASLVASGRGPALAIEVVERSELDLTVPAHAPALRVLVTQLAALEEHAKAQKAVDAALEAHPDEALFHELRGQVAWAAGEPELARTAFERAAELDPGGAAVALAGLAGLAAEAGERDAALALYDRAVEADPEDPAPALAAVKLVLDADDKQEVVRRLEQLLDRHPREAGAAHDLARILAEQGKLDRATDFARRAVWFRVPEADQTLASLQALRAEKEGMRAKSSAPGEDEG